MWSLFYFVVFVLKMTYIFLNSFFNLLVDIYFTDALFEKQESFILSQWASLAQKKSSWFCYHSLTSATTLQIMDIHGCTMDSSSMKNDYFFKENLSSWMFWCHCLYQSLMDAIKRDYTWFDWYSWLSMFDQQYPWKNQQPGKTTFILPKFIHVI